MEVYSNRNDFAEKKESLKTEQPEHAKESKQSEAGLIPKNEQGSDSDVHVFPNVTAYQMMVDEVEDIDTFVPAHEIKSEYKKWTPGEVSRGIFLGFCNTPGRIGKMIPSVRWMTSGGSIFHHYGEILVSDCKSFNLQEGTPIEIKFLGMKETKGRNNAMNFKVMILRRPNNKS